MMRILLSILAAAALIGVWGWWQVRNINRATRGEK